MHKLMKSKTFQLATVMLLAASIIATGTYAWSGFIGKSTRGTPQIIPDEVVLFDYSNQMGEIYVVNNTGYDMLVRVRFMQYLTVNGSSVVKGALADDPSTWQDSPEISKYYRAVFSNAVIGMDEWIEQGAPMGDYWVADSNGWHHYARKLPPGDATRNLLKEITESQFKQLVGEQYKTATYLQSVTRSELSDLMRLDSGSFTDNGRLLMRYISGEMVEFVK